MSSDLGKLSLLGVDFRIEEATLEGWTNASRPDGEVSWSLELRCERRDADQLALTDPRLCVENFHLPVADWKALENQSVLWSPEAPLQSDSAPVLYAGQHFDLPSSQIIIGARDGARFRVIWQGTVDLLSDGERAVPFVAEATATFTGITVTGAPGLDERIMADQLARRIAVEDLATAGARDAPDWPRRGWEGLLDRLFPGRRPRPNRIAEFKPDLD